MVTSLLEHRCGGIAKQLRIAWSEEPVDSHEQNALRQPGVSTPIRSLLLCRMPGGHVELAAAKPCRAARTDARYECTDPGARTTKPL